jgi:formylglycine-generating enzyme required for sulfatase activity
MELINGIAARTSGNHLIATGMVIAACLGRNAVADTNNGMVLVPGGKSIVGTSETERAELGERFDCHPTWLGDDLPKHEISLPAFWIDKHPVTNSQYLSFVNAAKHPRPAWWSRWGGVFPREYADHPVAGVSGKDAAAYAGWAGKRLPTAQEWETAVGGRKGTVFAWGDEWPGPLDIRPLDRVFWELPGTKSAGTGSCGRGVEGIEDFAGQVLEWVADTTPHHGVQFQLMKGASWFHKDPVNFRTASGWYAYEGWRSSFTGFRCALDGSEMPPRVNQSTPAAAISVVATRKQLKPVSDDGPITLAASGGTSRHVSIRVPDFGHESVGLSAPETIVWNGTSVMTWRKTPDMTWTARTPNRAAYEMRFDELRVSAEFLAQDDCVEQRFTAANLTDRPGSFRTSSCFNLQSHPMFYDCEQLRTYVLNAKGDFLPMRRVSRRGNCVRWITGGSTEELGGNLPWAILAVVSRDGRRIIATGRAGVGSGFSVATNTMFTCLHTDSTVQVPSNQPKTTRQYCWFLEGTLDDLSTRVRRDLTQN